MFFGLNKNKNKKSVIFDQEVADQCLLEVVETELSKQAHKSFSELCKEALWQFLCVPEALKPNPRKEAIEQQATEVQRQLAELERRLFNKESSRLEAIERQLHLLTQQISQLSVIVNQQQYLEPHQQPPQLESELQTLIPDTTQDADPLLNRLSPLLEDF
ncbi:MAG: plasmid segregation centromere-binding protein ParR [Symploca sp. SIO3C6]|nr:plasmid segregation centromere-binding protein ParR [Symploca sp. SIO3C6]NET04652.1 plasmid segregation centromere-binding protein ParR [Symploca sp. SIO2B6]